MMMAVLLATLAVIVSFLTNFSYKFLLRGLQTVNMADCVRKALPLRTEQGKA